MYAPEHIPSGPSVKLLGVPVEMEPATPLVAEAVGEDDADMVWIVRRVLDVLVEDIVEDEAEVATDVAGDGEATGAGLLLPDAEPEPDPDDSPPIPLTAWQVPLMVPVAVDEPVTSGPGFGNTTFVLSTTVHPLPMFATKISGRAEKATAGAARFLDPPAIVTEAQFMYISRLPMLLNQVQAKTAGPAGVSEGTVKSNSWPEFIGQPRRSGSQHFLSFLGRSKEQTKIFLPPMYECITLKVLPASIEREA